MARLLVVDDEQSMRVMLEARLSQGGHSVDVAPDVSGVERALAASEFDVVITDLRMRTGGDGLDVLRKVKTAQAEVEIILMTAFGKRELARRGRILAQDNELLREQLSARGRFESMVARSGAMHQVFDVVEKVAAARTTVLITGESGVGKELVARAVHARSPRSEAPFVPVNCGAIPEGLIESELFGHAKGAFTGAQGAKQGLFQAAQDGTLFLDEIGELPLSLQVKLLRAIQERSIRPVGDNSDVNVDVRLVAATNRDLAGEVRAGRFREDLYYRLNVVEIRVPALRERREDVLPLADHFLRRFAAEEYLAQIERELIDRALTESGGVKKDAAARLGLTFRQFRHRVKKLSGQPEDRQQEVEAARERARRAAVRFLGEHPQVRQQVADEEEGHPVRAGEDRRREAREQDRQRRQDGELHAEQRRGLQRGCAERVPGQPE